MHYIITSLLLIILTNVVATISLYGSEISNFVDVIRPCSLVMLTESICKAKALDVGVINSTGAILSLFICWPLLCVATKRVKIYIGDDSICEFYLCLSVLIIYFMYSQGRAPFVIYREEQFKFFANEISLINLVWPVCLQLISQSPNLTSAFYRSSFFVSLISYLPLRGPIFSGLIFGILVPGFTYFKSNMRNFSNISYKKMFLFFFSILIFISFLAFETKTRKTNLAVNGDIWSDTKAKLLQRSVMPLFQSVFADYHVIDVNIPSLSEELLAKFRLRSGRSLNGYLFSETHGGSQLGETTSLYYGEAVLRSSAPAIVWLIVSPLLFIITYLFILALGYDISVIVALALWRSSLGGVVELLPSLLIQIFIIVYIQYINRRSDANKMIA
jgi:hypothetical protein